MRKDRALSLPKGWEVRKLGEVCEILNGGTPKTKVSDYWDGTIKWITPKDLGKLETRYVSDTPRKISVLGLQKSSAKLISENSIILSTRAPIGHLAINKSEMATNQGCRGIIPSKKMDVYYLYYFLFSSVELLNDLGTGATFRELSTKALASIDIPLPSLSEQKRIVAKLDKAFDAIDQAKANAEKNLQNMQELFESYLNGVFDPSTRSGSKDGWEEVKWKDVLEVRSGRDYKSIVNPNGKYPIVGSAGKTMDFTNEYICEEGTTIIGRKGTINSPIFMKTKFWNVDTAFGLHALKILDKSFLYYFCLYFDFTELDKGSGRPSLVKSDLFKISMHIPHMDEQKKIVRKFNSLHKECEKMEAIYRQKIDDLEELKKSLLEKAFNGEL